jgi:hypothetical protein
VRAKLRPISGRNGVASPHPKWSCITSSESRRIGVADQVSCTLNKIKNDNSEKSRVLVTVGLPRETIDRPDMDWIKN